MPLLHLTHLQAIPTPLSDVLVASPGHDAVAVHADPHRSLHATGGLGLELQQMLLLLMMTPQPPPPSLLPLVEVLLPAAAMAMAAASG